MNSLHEIDWEKDCLWRGCILAAIAHAIRIAHDPDASNEHSWDGLNYSVQDTAGSRGTVTFTEDIFVAAFRDDASQSLRIEAFKNHQIFLSEAPEKIVKLAEKEAFEYLLDDIDGQIKPSITTAFWGTQMTTCLMDSKKDLLKNGAALLKYQLKHADESVALWRDYYNMSKEQTELLMSIYDRKIANPSSKITLTKNEIKQIGSRSKEGLKESRSSFKEIGIKL